MTGQMTKSDSSGRQRRGAIAARLLDGEESLSFPSLV